MHQQQQNIIRVISYDNAQRIKIEKPAPLDLHLKLHWNYNQQLLQGKGRENKGRQKKIYQEAFSVALRRTQFQPFPGSLNKWICWILESLPNHSPFPALHMELQARIKAGCISRVHAALSDPLPSFPVLSQLPWLGDKPQGKARLNPTWVHQWIRKV